MSVSIRLGVNVDHVATLRQLRGTHYPDPAAAAAICELAGAHQITVHCREDRRHVQERDLRVLRQTLQTQLNLEMAATQEMVQLCYEIKPDQATLVPERREELTTEGGLDVVSQREQIKKVIKTLRDGEIVASLFIDPDVDQVRAAHRADARRVELHTGRFCDARTAADRNRELARIIDAAKAAAKLGIGVAAGHGLSYTNVAAVAVIAEIDELNIGHAIVARAVLVGLDRAVRDMLALMQAAPRMINGLGLDVVEVARFDRLLAGPLGERLLARVFTVAERAYCDDHPAARAMHYAGRFAAKEALVKALAAPSGLTWQDMEVLSDGPPRFRTQGRCAEVLRERSVVAVHLSLSHDGGLAVAAVILET